MAPRITAERSVVGHSAAELSVEWCVSSLIRSAGRPAVDERAVEARCMQNACMTTVVVRDVPEDVHRRLQELAKAAGQSLQQFLSGELARLAATPTMREVLDRIEAHVTGHFEVEDVLTALEGERRHP